MLNNKLLETPRLSLLVPTAWESYELLDSGDQRKLERFGTYRIVRPESAAIWHHRLPDSLWDAADAVFLTADEETAGRWQFRQEPMARWNMTYKSLRFWVQPTSFRHLGVFPEQATQWDWLSEMIRDARRPIRVLNLFGYTGIATLAAAAAGAQVTHVDASRKVVAWARENQALSGLERCPVRWITDDALKFVRREVRRQSRYDGFIIDPPKYGRGPKGEVWKLEESLPQLLQACRSLISQRPLFLVLTLYAIRVSALGLLYILEDLTADFGGNLVSGEMGVRESSAGRILSTAAFARWTAQR